MTTLVPESAAASQPRRRVRRALAALRRVAVQRARFATEYGKATTADERFIAAATALRAAAAAGAHQPDPDDVARRLERLTDALTAAVAELHEAQENAATQTLRDDEKRIARNERRRGDGRPRTHPYPTHPDAGVGAGSAS